MVVSAIPPPSPKSASASRRACTVKSVKRGIGERDIPVRFAGVTFLPNHYLYADEDGLLVAEEPLL